MDTYQNKEKISKAAGEKEIWSTGEKIMHLIGESCNYMLHSLPDPSNLSFSANETASEKNRISATKYHL